MVVGEEAHRKTLSFNVLFYLSVFLQHPCFQSLIEPGEMCFIERPDSGLQKAAWVSSAKANLRLEDCFVGGNHLLSGFGSVSGKASM